MANENRSVHQRDSRNRFLPLDHELAILAFSCLRELQLNRTFISWIEFRDVAKFMTSLRSVELGHNYLESLSARSSSAVPELVSLNFEDNLLDDWIQTAKSLREITTYDRNNYSLVVLTLSQLATVNSLRQRHSLHPASQLGVIPASGHQRPCPIKE